MRRQGHSACAVGLHHIVVFGGCDDRNRPFNDVHILDCAYRPASPNHLAMPPVEAFVQQEDDGSESSASEEPDEEDIPGVVEIDDYRDEGLPEAGEGDGDIVDEGSGRPQASSKNDLLPANLPPLPPLALHTIANTHVRTPGDAMPGQGHGREEPTGRGSTVKAARPGKAVGNEDEGKGGVAEGGESQGAEGEPTVSRILSYHGPRRNYFEFDGGRGSTPKKRRRRPWQSASPERREQHKEEAGTQVVGGSTRVAGARGRSHSLVRGRSARSKGASSRAQDQAARDSHTYMAVGGGRWFV